MQLKKDGQNYGIGKKNDRKKIELNEFFLKEVKAQFRFLERDYFFKFHESIINTLSITIIYQNNTTAVSITLDQEFGMIFVDLIRLINNKISELPSEISKYTELNEFDFEDLLSIRNPKIKIEKPSLDDLVFLPGWEKVVSRILHQYAINLKKYCDDVLKGDFYIFKELDKIVKKRAKAQQ
jgi:hypothetical protein